MKYLLVSLLTAASMMFGGEVAHADACDTVASTDGAFPVTAPQASSMTTGSQRDRHYYRSPTFCPKHPYQDASQSSSPTSSKR